MKSLSSLLALTLATTLTLSGCATNALIEKDSGYTKTETVNKVLVNDYVLAFGKPNLPLPNLPSDALVIVGQKHSYVLTQGGHQFQTLLTHLDPTYIKVIKPLNFYSASNDGSFTGILSLKYTCLKDDIKKSDLDLFLQNNVADCTSSSDISLNAQSFCFDIDLKGLSYPAVNNQAQLKTLSKAYPVSIYTTQTITNHQAGKNNPIETLVLFPFAVAFDVVTLPFQAIGKIFD